jgi:RNA polymerase-binding transcription factor DksA
MKKQVPAKTVVIAKAPAKRTERPEADQQIRAAYGVYGGVVICDNPKPFPKRSPYTPKEMKTLRELLLEERIRLRDVLRSLDEMTLRHPDDEADSTVPGYSFHLAENATDNVDTETALLLRRDEEAALVQVEAAVERLEHGLFGVCMACSSKIGMDRLKAKPEAHLCMTCQKVYDEKVTSR